MNKTALYVAIGCVVVLGGIMVTAIVLNEQEAAQVRTDGVRVSATVLETSSNKTGWSSRTGDKISYCVRLAFKTQKGEEAKGTNCNLSQETWAALKQGDTVDAVYIPGTLYAIEGEHTAEVSLWSQVAP
ncbi:DUF3592 domain-containing protein [Myxococcus sp. K38C18041901]|uniref:DUF3592 domain-containing protein n=1 Tax=Myxococcus guangdongensis TaxID=2906760 RepID=UPI0020A7B982|nr:DUF3592 domain-containing protein [Myxococcus guangdongensis]MCP3061485.1 DUF3592 domain-containing protein [Myxococcus guangdongensis]